MNLLRGATPNLETGTAVVTAVATPSLQTGGSLVVQGSNSCCFADSPVTSKAQLRAASESHEFCIFHHDPVPMVMI